MKDIELKDEYLKKHENNHVRFSFLSKLIDWLNCWLLRSARVEIVSTNFTSLTHSCLALAKIVNYITMHRQFNYILSSRLENDPLEHHFWGVSNVCDQYHISNCQILEPD